MPSSVHDRPTDQRPRKLVVTLGPASWGSEADLQRAGATALRFNASHLVPGELVRRLKGARERSEVAVSIVDLQGAKMRVGQFAPRAVEPGQTLTLVQEDQSSDASIPLPHRQAFEQLEPGDWVSLDDDRLQAKVESVGRLRLTLVLANGGTLRPRKGFNRARHPIELVEMTAADREAIDAALDGGCRRFALSFVSSPAECAWVRNRAPQAQVIAKIERQLALDSLSEIAEAADELWICRGDLGAQVGWTALGAQVARVAPRELGLPVLMAGQVLEHLTAHEQPTRSEICHVHDLLERGYSGVVLSDETAIGCDPIRATGWAARLLGL